MFKTILLSLFLVGSHHFETVTPTPSPTINQAPQLKGYEIGTQTGKEDEVFEFDVPVEDIFYDDNELTYSANEATKEALPKWLAFNDESYSFFGLPSDTDIGRYNISLTATDQGGLEASTYFLIEIMGQSENKDSLSSGGITGIILGLLAAISPCIVDGIAYARWRIKKKTEEEDDGPSSLVTCENYRSECCKGKFKFLNCYNKCDGCCSTVFSCFCDDCCKACCKEDSCNCCVSSYHHPSGNDEKELKTHHTNNSTHNTHVKNDHRSQVTNHYHHNVQVVKEEKNTTSNQRLEHEKLKIEIENLRNQLKDKDTKLYEKSQQLNEKNEQLNELKSTLKEKDINHQHEIKEKDQEIQEYTNELSNKNERIESLNNQLNEKSQELKEKDEQIITLQVQAKQSSNELNNKSQLIENLRNQLKEKDTKLNDKSQQLNEKNEQLTTLKFSLKEKDINHQKEINEKNNQIQEHTNELNNKNERIETLSNQLKDKDTNLDEKSQQLNELKSTLKESSVKHQQELKKREDQLEEKDEKINMLSNEVNKKDNQLNDKDNTISSLNNVIKENQQKIAALQNILQEIPKQPLDDNKKEELFKAIKNNNINKVKMFLCAYKDVVNAEDDYERTPFLWAACNEGLDIAKLLKEHGANIHAKDEKGDNALHLACYYSGSVEMVTWLLDECKIDIEAKGYKQRMPFLFAALKGQVEIAKLLKERGANIHAKDEEGNNALHCACRYSGSVEMVNWVVDVCKIDIEAKGHWERTPFFCAAENGQLAIAKLLKERGANVNAKNEDGNNALKLAKEWNNKEMISYLKSLGLT